MDWKPSSECFQRNGSGILNTFIWDLDIHSESLTRNLNSRLTNLKGYRAEQPDN